MSKDLEFVHKYRRGEIKLGETWGSEIIDKWWLYKQNFTVLLGNSGSGKTTLITYMCLLQSIRQGKKTLVWSSENSRLELIVMCVNAILDADLRHIPAEQVSDAYDKVNEYMDFVDSHTPTSVYGIMAAADKRLTEDYHAIIIDPWSSLKKDTEKGKYKSSYDYNYDALTDLRQWRDNKGVALYLCVHPNTDAKRRRHKEDHQYADQVSPPNAADVEHGGMFENRADDMIVVHRYKQDANDWNITKIWTAKIKSHMTGGKENPIEIPIEGTFDGKRFHFGGVDILQRAINEKWGNDSREEITAY